MNEILRKNGESKFSYVKRLTENRKEYDLDYAEWVKLICNYDCSSENGRKAHYVISRLLDELEEEMVAEAIDNSDSNTIEDMIKELEMKKREIFKEKVKLQDLRNAMRKEDRVEARWENAMEHLYSSIKSLPPIKIEFAKDNTGDAEACILISDTHFGKGVKTPHNEYNLEIAKERLDTLATQTIKYAKMHNVGVLNIDILGDLIENNLHLDAQVDQVCDAMEQVA